MCNCSIQQRLDIAVCHSRCVGFSYLWLSHSPLLCHLQHYSLSSLALLFLYIRYIFRPTRSAKVPSTSLSLSLLLCLSTFEHATHTYVQPAHEPPTYIIFTRVERVRSAGARNVIHRGS